MSADKWYDCEFSQSNLSRSNIGVARGGAVGAPAPPRAVKKNFVRPNLQGKCVSAPPQDTKCTPQPEQVNF